MTLLAGLQIVGVAMLHRTKRVYTDCTVQNIITNTTAFIKQKISHNAYSQFIPKSNPLNACYVTNTVIAAQLAECKNSKQQWANRKQVNGHLKKEKLQIQKEYTSIFILYNRI
jgi:hypothetical protein